MNSFDHIYEWSAKRYQRLFDCLNVPQTFWTHERAENVFGLEWRLFPAIASMGEHSIASIKERNSAISADESNGIAHGNIQGDLTLQIDNQRKQLLEETVNVEPVDASSQTHIGKSVTQPYDLSSQQRIELSTLNASARRAEALKVCYQAATNSEAIALAIKFAEKAGSQSLADEMVLVLAEEDPRWLSHEFSSIQNNYISWRIAEALSSEVSDQPEAQAEWARAAAVLRGVHEAK